MTNSTQGTTVAFMYDAWGRTVGARSATYSYKYGSKLASVTSTLFGEANVAFEYGGDQKRRGVTTGGVTRQYNWDMGWNVINEEDNAGALVRTYTHNPQEPGRVTLGHVDGTNPATGAYRYYVHDHLGSTRFVVNDEIDLLATYQYTPYGDILSSNNPNTTTHLFTGHDWNPASNLYFAPYRYYNPQTARWLTRDPLGMVDGPNIYAYTVNRRTRLVDPDGRWWRLIVIGAGFLLLCIGAKKGCDKGIRNCIKIGQRRAGQNPKPTDGDDDVTDQEFLKYGTGCFSTGPTSSGGSGPTDLLLLFIVLVVFAISRKRTIYLENPKYI